MSTQAVRASISGIFIHKMQLNMLRSYLMSLTDPQARDREARDCYGVVSLEHSLSCVPRSAIHEVSPGGMVLI